MKVSSVREKFFLNIETWLIFLSHLGQKFCSSSGWVLIGGTKQKCKFYLYQLSEIVNFLTTYFSKMFFCYSEICFMWEKYLLWSNFKVSLRPCGKVCHYQLYTIALLLIILIIKRSYIIGDVRVYHMALTTCKKEMIIT